MKDIQPGSLKTISEDKLATFAVGKQRKSQLQRAREEAEEKKRLEEIEASKLYDSFVASFEGDDDSNSKTFVRGGGGGSDYSSGRAGDVYKLEGRGGGSSSRGSRQPPSSNAASSSVAGAKPLREMDRMLQDFKVLDMLLLSS